MTMWQKLKTWVLDQILWAEKNMPGKSGAEKRKAVVDRLDDLIRLPFYFEWVDGPLIGWLVDSICEKLNWLTNYNFNAISNSKNLETAIDMPMGMTASATDIPDVDARLAEICEKYSIKTELEEAVANIPGVSFTPADSKPLEIDWFKKCIDFTLQYEGGANFTVKDGKPVLKSNAKADAGGATKYGITWATLKAAYVQDVVSHNDICKLTRDEAKAIYHKNYWTRYGWDQLAWPVNLCCLDCCVNHGGFAWILQRALVDRKYKVTIDGKFGPATFNALKAACANPTALALAIIEQRRKYFRDIVKRKPSQNVYLNGWLNRCNALEKEVKANAVA